MEKEFIPLSVPNITGNELKYVSETIETEWVSSVGSYVDQFEKDFAQYIGSKYAVAVVNGTAAIHGEYKGKIESYKQVLDNGCGTCRLATIKIAANGTLTPATSVQG